MPAAEHYTHHDFSNPTAWGEHTPSAIISETTAFSIEKELQERTLKQEMAHLQLNWKKEGLPQDWADLPGTGFLVKTQMENLRKTMAREDIATRGEKLGIWVKQTEADLKGFNIEFLNERLVFPLSYDIREREGKQRVINTFHGGDLLLEDSVSKNERNGATHDVLVNQFEPFFLTAAEGSIGVMISPSGDSGMYDDQGERVLFPDSITFIWQKKGGKIVGYGVKTNFTYNEHREFLKRLTGKQLALDAPIEEYVRTSGLFSSDQADIHGIRQMEDVVNIMRDTRFDMSGGSLFAYKDKMWSEVYKDIDRGEQLWDVDEKTGKVISEFVEFANEDTWDETTLKQAMAVSVLRMSKLVLGKTMELGTEKVTVRRESSWGDAFHKAGEVMGCSGGGGRRVALDAMGRPIMSGGMADCAKCQDSPCGICEEHAFVEQLGGE